MSLFSYHIFDAVVKQKSFLKAAEVMNLTPSAVSHSIASLESMLGFPLFVRTRTGVQLTSEAESLIIHVRTILNCEEQLMQEVAQINGLNKGTVVIGAFNSVCINWIPDIIKTFEILYPNINVNIFQGGYEDIISWSKMGIIDIGFGILPVSGDLVETPLHKDRLVCITPNNYKPARSKYVTIDDIRNKTFVLQREGTNADIMAFIKKYDLSVRSQFFMEDDQSIIAMVESGFGISIVPELVLSKLKNDVNIYPIKPEEYRVIGLLTNKKQLLAPATVKMFHHIIDYVKENNLMNVDNPKSMKSKV
ncbi:MAG: LysR family transcriptional regulator [Solirubrobacterales bacterium]